MKFFAIAFFFGLVPALFGADTTPKQTGYTAFHLVRTRNIFDPDRRAMLPQTGPVAPAAKTSVPDFVALTGTLVTGDKALAFFSGSRPEFSAVLAVSGTVANMKVAKITPSQIEVNRAGKSIVMAVGQQLALDGTAPVATVVTAVPDASPTSTDAPAGVPSGQQDLIRRMMERRQRETSR